MFNKKVESSLESPEKPLHVSGYGLMSSSKSWHYSSKKVTAGTYCISDVIVVTHL